MHQPPELTTEDPADIAFALWREGRVLRARLAREPFFMNLPDAWYEAQRFACANGHVSGTVLGTDSGDLCLSCRSPMRLIPPEAESDMEHLSHVFYSNGASTFP